MSHVSLTEDPPRYFTADEVAGYIRSTVLTVRVKTSRREIPHIKIGRRVLYDRERIDQWLAEQAVPIAG